MDLRDLWRPGSGVTPRYVLLLVGQLPVDSALNAARRGGPEFRPWTPPMYLLTAIANLLHAGNRQRGGKKTKEPLIKPPQQQSTARRVSVAEIARRPGALVSDN